MLQAKFLAVAIDSVGRVVVVSDGQGNGLYKGEVCDVGTCCRPPNHDRPHEQFDGPRAADSVPFHPIPQKDQRKK